MKTLVLVLFVLPIASLASETDIGLHLDCGQGDVCAEFILKDGSPVSLKKDPEMIIRQESLESAEITQSDIGQPLLSLRLKPEGAKKMADLTERAVGQTIAIVVGNKVISQPRVVERIDHGSLQLASGASEKPFWNSIPWIDALAAEQRNAIAEQNRISMIIYVVVGLALLLGALWFVFGRKETSQN